MNLLKINPLKDKFCFGDVSIGNVFACFALFAVQKPLYTKRGGGSVYSLLQNPRDLLSCYNWCFPGSCTQLQLDKNKVRLPSAKLRLVERLVQILAEEGFVSALCDITYCFSPLHWSLPGRPQLKQLRSCLNNYNDMCVILAISMLLNVQLMQRLWFIGTKGSEWCWLRLLLTVHVCAPPSFHLLSPSCRKLIRPCVPPVCVNLFSDRSN